MATLQARWESDMRSFVFLVLHARVQGAGRG